jgi:transposase
VLERLLPQRPAQRTGRPRVSDRAAFTAIVFVLVTGVPWRMVPKGDRVLPVTAWRRLRDWQGAGVWERLHGDLLRRLNAPGSDRLVAGRRGLQPDPRSDRAVAG